MPYIALKPFMEGQEAFLEYVTFEDNESLVYNRFLMYREKLDQVVARIFLLEVLLEEKRSEEQILRYRREYRLPVSLSGKSVDSQLEEALSEGKKITTLPLEEQAEECLRRDYLLYNTVHDLIYSDLGEYMKNTIIMFRPNYNEGDRVLATAFEQPTFRGKVDVVVFCYHKMVQRIKEVKGWQDQK